MSDKSKITFNNVPTCFEIFMTEQEGCVDVLKCFWNLMVKSKHHSGGIVLSKIPCIQSVELVVKTILLK